MKRSELGSEPSPHMHRDYMKAVSRLRMGVASRGEPSHVLRKDAARRRLRRQRSSGLGQVREESTRLKRLAADLPLDKSSSRSSFEKVSGDTPSRPKMVSRFTHLWLIPTPSSDCLREGGHVDCRPEDSHDHQHLSCEAPLDTGHRPPTWPA